MSESVTGEGVDDDQLKGDDDEEEEEEEVNFPRAKQP